MLDFAQALVDSHHTSIGESGEERVRAVRERLRSGVAAEQLAGDLRIVQLVAQLRWLRCIQSIVQSFLKVRRFIALGVEGKVFERNQSDRNADGNHQVRLTEQHLDDSPDETAASLGIVFLGRF